MEINTSTLEDPLAFFECILSRDGIAALRNEFIPTDDEIFYSSRSLAYDVFTEVKEQRFYDPNIGDEVNEITNFRDFLYKRCSAEYSKSISLIDEKILSMHSEDFISVYVNVLFVRLNYLRESIVLNGEVGKYGELQKFSDKLERVLSGKYNSYIKNYEQNDLSDNSKITPPPILYQIKRPENPERFSAKHKRTKELNPGVFKWAKGDSKNLSNLLYKFLSENKMIDTTSNEFSKAFSGMQCETPLKIKWTDPAINKADINKATLLYLFKKLCENELIETRFESKEINKKLAHVFVDRKGNEIKHLGISKNSIGKTKTVTPSKKLIDEFISSISS